MRESVLQLYIKAGKLVMSLATPFCQPSLISGGKLCLIAVIEHRFHPSDSVLFTTCLSTNSHVCDFLAHGIKALVHPRLCDILEGAESSAEQTDTQSDSEPRRTTSTDPTLEKIPEGDEGKEEQEDTNNHTENSAADDAPPPADGPDGAVADQAPE